MFVNFVRQLFDFEDLSKPSENIPKVLPNTSQDIPTKVKMTPTSPGIEPGTLGFGVREPTHWAIPGPEGSP